MAVISKKKDPSITFLNKFGYNVIRLPRTGIEPLDLIGRDHGVHPLGRLSKVWASAIPEPQPGPPQRSAAVNGQRTDELELSLGLSILADTLAAFGVSAPSFDLAYKSARAVQFTYTNVTSTSVSPFDAGEYLSKGTLHTENPSFKNYFENEKNSAYLILDVLKADSITVIATDARGGKVGVDLPHLEAIVDAKIGIKPSVSSSSTVTFTGPVPVAFGFAVQRIARKDNAWVLTGEEPRGDLSFKVTDSGKGPGASVQANPMVFDTGEFDCRLDL